MRTSLAELEAVQAVATHRGYRAAARDLGVASSTLSNAIAALEQRLSIRLFNRTTRSVVLTPAGQAFLSEIGPALSMIENAIENASEHATRPTGILKLNMALGAARMLLKRIFLEYARRYPEVEVEIATEGALVDVIGKGFDAGIRLAEAVPPDMAAIPVQRLLRSAVVGSPEYFTKYPVPQNPSDLTDHICIRLRFAAGRIYRWEFEKHGEALHINVTGNLVLDASDLLLDAALDGAGLAHLGEPTVRAHVKSGALVSGLEDWLPPYPGLCLYYPRVRLVPMRLRALIELIREMDKRKVPENY